MVEASSIFEACRSGVCQIIFERGRERICSGSAFRVPGGLVTNSHVLRGSDFEVGIIQFEDMAEDEVIRLSRDDILAAIEHESPENDHDVAFLRIDEPEFSGRHIFSFGESECLSVGDQIGFIGFPFQMPQLTCHMGYVSSIYQSGPVTVIQIDGSINGGNSGGPLVSLGDGKVVGVITRSEVGFIASQFDALLGSLRNNVSLLETTPEAIQINGIGLISGLRSSQAAMLEIATNLRRSANVGIGYAFASNQIRDHFADNEAG